MGMREGDSYDMFGRVAGLIVDFLLDRPPESNHRVT